ncbi:MAG: methyl-accepting chemotaxis protein [Bacteroidota bacterium]
MKTTSYFSTRAKLVLSFGLIILATLTTVLVSYLITNHNKNTQNQMIHSFEVTSLLTQIRSDENRVAAVTFELFVERDAAKRDTLYREIRLQVREIEASCDAIEQNLVSEKEELNLFREIINLMKVYRENRQYLLSLIQQGKMDEATTFTINTQKPMYENIRSQIITLEDNLKERTKTIVSRDNSLARIDFFILVIMGAGMLLLLIIILIWIFRMLRKIFSEITTGVNILGTSATEILTTVSEVSTGATETATSIAETATTVEEIRQTAMMATQTAQSVLLSSQRAAESAENGKESVLQTIEGMKKIDQHMNLIAETIVKLSEQNRSIGEITSTVNDIADQSNLLAVNAAIEAAKAGEQGRGFAVVAQEIRSLSEQSKQATRQVKEILNDVQKAVNQAVMATEQGSKAVENGSNLAMQSGEMIENLADSVNEAAQSVIQISTSIQQQMNGMDQIVPALGNIKQASEQNIIGIKQTQNATQNLQELGLNLKKIVEKFTI